MGVKMRSGEGVSKDNSRSTSCSRRKTVRNCKGNHDNVVVIDVDSDGLDHVIVIDVPESLQSKLNGYGVVRERNRFPLHGIISIDDDDDDKDEEDDDGSDHLDDLEGDMPCEREVNNIGDSSKSSPDSDTAVKSVGAAVDDDDDDDDCQVVQEQRPVFNLSRCNKSHDAEASSRNCYGLFSDFESDSESDSSDSEILLGCSRELREQWEKASLKRKYSQRQSGLKDQASPCSSYGHSDSDISAEDGSKHDGDPEIECSIFGNVHCEEVNSSAFINVVDGCEGDLPSHLNMKVPFTEPAQNTEPESSPWWSKSRVREKTGLYNNNDHFNMRHSMEDHTFCSEECPYVASVSTGFVDKKKDTQGPSASSNHVGNDKLHDQMKTNVREDKDQNMNESFRFPDDRPMPDLYTDSGKNCVRKEEPNLPNTHSPGEIDNSTMKISLDKLDYQDIGERSNGSQCHKVLHKQVTVPDIRLCGKRDPLCGLQDVVPANSGDIINEREKLKETDEYKQAVEQEWAARQHQLKLQAEEAQRLRKRKKAECLRILDMEKRQKQRLEEVRETQKKDEENLHMKERLRAELRKELHMLEMTCFDMASVLRQLGIPVGSGFQPLPHEVHAAYKRALLKFHPDRVSRSDIRQQVEAEEKFKLVCRMKERFLPSQ